jgi:hypothetical protein
MSSFIICCCSAFVLLISLIKYCYRYNKIRRYRYDDIIIRRHDSLDFDYSYHLDDRDDDILLI